MKFLRSLMMMLLPGILFAAGGGVVVNNGDSPVFTSLTCTGSPCGSGGGGGGPNGTINVGAQNSIPFYSVAGSSNVASALSGVTTNGTNGLTATGTMTAGTFNGTGLTASLPVQTDGSKNLTSAAITLSGSQVTGLLPVANGGTGTASPGLIAGTNITSITGAWPNQTINASAAGGGVNAGTTGQTAYYAANGATVSGSSNLLVNTSSVAILAPLGLNVTYNATLGSATVNNLTASLPVQTDASKNLTSAAINLSGSQVTGSLPAASIAAGSLGASVLASSISANSVYPAAVQSGAYPNITGVGTLASGVWNGTALTSTYLPTQTEYTNVVETITSSRTFSGQVNISSSILLSGSAGTNGQVFTSGGPNTIPSWTTPSAGGGAVAVSTGNAITATQLTNSVNTIVFATKTVSVTLVGASSVTVSAITYNPADPTQFFNYNAAIMNAYSNTNSWDYTGGLNGGGGTGSGAAVAIGKLNPLYGYTNSTGAIGGFFFPAGSNYVDGIFDYFSGSSPSSLYISSTFQALDGNTTDYIGLTINTGSNQPEPATEFYGCRANGSGDWFAVIRHSGSDVTTADTGVSKNTSIHRFQIDNSANAGNSIQGIATANTIRCCVDGVCAVASGTIPSETNLLAFYGGLALNSTNGVMAFTDYELWLRNLPIQ